MSRITRPALEQVRELLRYYAGQDRPESGRKLLADLGRAQRLIEADPRSGLSHPRPYPGLARLGLKWTLVRVYWIAWTRSNGDLVIANVLHATSDMEARAIPLTDDVLNW